MNVILDLDQGVEPGIFILGYCLALVEVYTLGFNFWGLRHHKEICLIGLNTTKPILCFRIYSSVSFVKHLNKKSCSLQKTFKKVKCFNGYYKMYYKMFLFEASQEMHFAIHVVVQYFPDIDST